MDHLVPRVHLRPPHGFINDPNGPIVVDGTLHLYYQSRASNDPAEPVSWGHATSSDYVHFTHHRPAMAPQPGSVDGDGCWSGNTIATDDGIRAFYSGFLRDEPLQVTATALSTDGGATFGAPSVAAPPPPDVAELRDPFVWREGDRYRMAVGAGSGSGNAVASIRMWESRDLASWEYTGVLTSLARTRTDDVDTGSMWECPQVLEVDGATVALVGTWASEGGTLQVIGVLPDGQGDRLDGLGCHPIDEGTAFYASSALRDGPRGPLVWGWVVEDREESWWREDGWAGAISLPREVRLGAGGRVLSAPAAEVSALRVGEAVDVAVSGAEVGAQVELSVSASVGEGVAIEFGPRERVELRVAEDGTVVLDRSASSTDARARLGDVRIPDAVEDGRAELRVFLDGSVLEVFASTGRTATTRVYPLTPPPWRLGVVGGAAVRAWALE